MYVLCTDKSKAIEILVTCHITGQLLVKQASLFLRSQAGEHRLEALLQQFRCWVFFFFFPRTELSVWVFPKCRQSRSYFVTAWRMLFASTCPRSAIQDRLDWASAWDQAGFHLRQTGTISLGDRVFLPVKEVTSYGMSLE